jgi:GTP-binding protein
VSARRPVVAVVGRANVGKSTLINRFLGRRVAIEHAEPGVTRDRQSYEVRWGGRAFDVIDTGGWEPRATGLSAKVLAQAERAIDQADLILFVVDVTTGATADDLVVARTLRRGETPVIVVANKVDSAAREADATVLERLGLGPAFSVSALHGRASGDLLDAIAAELPAPPETADENRQTRVAIVGRPNVGKSSLFNRLVGEERSIVHETPGTTRDAVDTTVVLGDHTYRFIDTAGMRRRAKEASGPEYYGLVRSLRAVDEADVAIVVVDAVEGPTLQDQRIAERVARAGRAAVIAVNKWDLVDEDRRPAIEEAVREELHFVAWAPVLRTSALTGRGVTRLMPAVERSLGAWEQRVPTAALNAWLRSSIERIPLSSGGTKPARIRYVTQAGTRPPHVIVFATARITDQAARALERSLRDRFGFGGTPIRISVRVRSRADRPS